MVSSWLPWEIPAAIVCLGLILGSCVCICKACAQRQQSNAMGDPLLDGMFDQGIPIQIDGIPDSLKAFQVEELALATRDWNENLLLGEGGFGKVFLIESLLSMPYAGQCAVKKLSPNAAQGTAELQTEIQVLGTCRHENVLPLLGFCLHPRSPCLVYPLMRGGNLDDRIMLSPDALGRLYMLQLGAEWPALHWSQRLRIIRDTMRAISYLHTPLVGLTQSKETILHRDIKPSNILLDEHLNAKLSDVGLARQTHELQEGRTHLSTSKVVGTHGFIDPLYTQTGRFNQTTDNYALGMTILVAMVAKPAQQAHDECDEIFEESTSLAPNHADPSAGWPHNVAVSLAEVIKGLTYARTARNRTSLAAALHQVEALCNTTDQVPTGFVVSEGEEAKECIVCMANPRAVRFGCGHFCCCTTCSDQLRDQRMGCPTCRVPITTVDGASPNEPTFIMRGQPLVPVGEDDMHFSDSD